MGIDEKEGGQVTKLLELNRSLGKETLNSALQLLSNRHEYGDNHGYGDDVNKYGVLTEDATDICGQHVLGEAEDKDDERQ